MEGRGVTNYAVGRPSYGFSTTTTEFDDALISRGIVTFEQAMIAKGASPNEARCLAKLHQNGVSNGPSALKNHDTNGSNAHRLGDGYDDVLDASNEDDNGDDEQFIQTYRRMRINEMKKGRKQEYGDVISISRPDWNREVNEASKDGLWVIVNLTRSSTCSKTQNEICDKVEEITRDLADKFLDVKFVSIPSTSAINNWPDENLPTLFCYRYGKMQHQLLGVQEMGGAGINSGRLEWRLAMLGVFETELERDPKPDRAQNSFGSVRSQFGGTSVGATSRLAKAKDDDIEDYDNYDDVD